MKNYTEEQLKALSTSEWVEILKENPDLADKCGKWEDFSGWYWSELLSAHPQLAGRCDKWEEFDGEDWSNLLSAQPQLADRRKNQSK